MLYCTLRPLFSVSTRQLSGIIGTHNNNNKMPTPMPPQEMCFLSNVCKLVFSNPFVGSGCPFSEGTPAACCRPTGLWGGGGAGMHLTNKLWERDWQNHRRRRIIHHVLFSINYIYRFDIHCPLWLSELKSSVAGRACLLLSASWCALTCPSQIRGRGIVQSFD